MYYLCLLGVCVWRACVAVAESHAYGYQHVALLLLDVWRIVAVHSEHTHVQRVVGRQCGESEEGACRRNVGFLKKLHQLVLCAAQLHSVTHERERLLGGVDKSCRFLHGLLVEGGVGNIAAHEIHLGRMPFGLLHLCVLREVKHHWTRAACACNVERAAHSPCHVLGTAYLVAPFRYWLCHAHEVNLLEGVGAEHAGAHLSCYHHNRCGVHHGVGNTREGVCGAWSAGYDTHSHFVAHPCIAFRSVCGSLLVAHEYVVKSFLLSPRIVVEGVVNWHYGASGIAENGLHPFFLESSHQSLCSCYIIV